MEEHAETCRSIFYDVVEQSSRVMSRSSRPEIPDIRGINYLLKGNR